MSDVFLGAFLEMAPFIQLLILIAGIECALARLLMIVRDDLNKTSAARRARLEKQMALGDSSNPKEKHEDSDPKEKPE